MSDQLVGGRVDVPALANANGTGEAALASKIAIDRVTYRAGEVVLVNNSIVVIQAPATIGDTLGLLVLKCADVTQVTPSAQRCRIRPETFFVCLDHALVEKVAAWSEEAVYRLLVLKK